MYHTDLEVWKMSFQHCKNIYLFTLKLPEEEKFGLVSQLRRAAVSIPSNIAEGASRNSNKDFARFSRISLGSLFEVETQLLLSIELFNISAQEILNENLEVRKVLRGFIRHLEKGS